ncbi:glycosyl transferase group 1 [Pseudanabaena sp. lw0831]|uniref:glycosyltransferase family 4 protein n=1 Tax=Pseudanabaena sp. lw0831 TaxID=1357935 RepID=UPI001A2B7559|nr:glycosyltransferase family 4 protein [Pseudanabaena sp. lw0831]GBO53806.1 glycosyl transferase group 1 [Pseudanabaena sp. lw0831]
MSIDLRDKHILVISSVYPTTPDGNHGAFIRETVLQMRSLGIRFTIFAPAYEGSQTHSLDDIEVYRFRYFFKRFENLVRDGAPTKLQKQPLYILVALLYIVLGAWQLFWLCKKQKPDLIHVNWPFPHGLMAYPVNKLLGIPMLFSFHGAELLLAKKFSFVGAILRWQIPMAKSVTANSSFTQALIQKLYSGDVSVIPYGLTIEPKAPCVRNLEEDTKLLFVGRLDERKGLRYLLEALPLVLSKYPVRLRIVGKGILEQEIKQQCQELKLEKVIDFLGFVSKEELANEYASCNIFVLPAIVDSKGDTEGLGIVMIEALAHEKPVIASAVGGIVDVIQSGVTGLLVNEKDPEALSQSIIELIADPVRAEELGQRGLKDIQVRFGWSRLILLWQDMFTKALAKT